MENKSDAHEEFYFDYIRLLVENRMLHRSGYYLGASNSFVRLFTITARRYWLAQATSEHITADWKVHFSIRPRDISLAFNLLSELYYQMKLPIGLKARYPDHWKDYENEWPKHMRGREITVYIFLYENTVKTNQTMVYSSKNLNQSKYMIDWILSSTKDIYENHDLKKTDEIPLDRYLDYVDQAEKLLEQYRIESNGCADGDYPIGKYTSLRNEKFVAIEDYDDNTKIRLIYPPNECGYNGSNDKRDLTKEIVDLKTYRIKKRQNKIIKIIFFITIIFLLIVFLINLL
ncbi:unnamed protein product [Adineta steineri]|uniref:Uncharacterized protein n=1 Tax=Adineta steineri TaxID=433720 RepID=A0A818K1W5_9BILA|nr:unnamed protein product [Adineta steineri]CAF3544678.1 unnamed protein product [Adineta steineri]CAF3952900.1 unnamed protein product [Adineta steineri]